MTAISTNSAPPLRPSRSEWRSWPLLARVITIVAGAFLALFVVWLLVAARFLVNADPSPPRSDVVVVLSGGQFGHRLRRGIEVFQRSGSARLAVFIPESEGLFDLREPARVVLTRSGVPTESVRYLTGSRSTSGEARSVAGLAERCGWSTITVVTSPYHTRRAGWLFGRALPNDVSVVMTATSEPFTRGAWFTDEHSAESVLIEWMKILAGSRYLVTGLDPIDPGVPC